MCHLEGNISVHMPVYDTVARQSENEKFSENTVFFFAVLKMEVSRCCLP